ncbi:hypothetical protein [Pontibacter populi]|uniref:Lipoprotein n=1 Tax=Pontibacter populi TaxID=890055 RepID=A0ABV1RUX1_9BACT
MRLLNFLFVFIMLFTSSCDPHDTRLKIINSTDENVFYVISGNDSLHYSPLYIQGQDTIWDLSSMIKPKSEINEAMVGSEGWEDYIKSESKDNNLRVYFFDEKLIEKYSWESLLQNNQYSKLYRLSIAELEKNGWLIEYE